MILEKYLLEIGAINLVRSYLMTDLFTPLPLCALAPILDDLPPFPQLRTYLMDGLFLNQKKQITFKYRIH